VRGRAAPQAEDLADPRVPPSDLRRVLNFTGDKFDLLDRRDAPRSEGDRISQPPLRRLVLVLDPAPFYNRGGGRVVGVGALSTWWGAARSV
jgi:hypothetical protein